VRGSDGQLTYVIKRFDRKGRKGKVAKEDFAQLSGMSRETKYNSSMEKVVKIIDEYCTFPMIEKSKLFLRVLFTFLTGNEDTHLKNFSVISLQSKVVLSPAYDLLNTTIAIPNPIEEMALPINSKKRKLTKEDLVDYYGKKCLQLNDKTIQSILRRLMVATRSWDTIIGSCFLSSDKQYEYMELLKFRTKRLFPGI